MSMLKTTRNDVKLPRTANLAPAPPAPMPYYDEEVLRVAQRDYDNKKLIAQLEGERDEWRRKCLATEEDNKRLQIRLDRDAQAHDSEVAKLTEQRDAKIDELTAQRDDYKLKLARFETKIVMVAESLIKLANSTSEATSKLLDEIRRENPTTDVAGAVGLAAIADELDPLPGIVTAGPAQENSETSPRT